MPVFSPKKTFEGFTSPFFYYPMAKFHQKKTPVGDLLKNIIY